MGYGYVETVSVSWLSGHLQDREAWRLINALTLILMLRYSAATLVSNTANGHYRSTLVAGIIT